MANTEKGLFVPSEDFDIRTLEYRLGVLHDDVKDVRGSMNKLADAITKLALIEERQGNTNLLIGQVRDKLENIEGRVSQLEINAPTVNRTSMWVDRAVLFVVGAVAMMIFTNLMGVE